MSVRCCLELGTLLLEGSGAVTADDFATCVVEQLDVKPNEISEVIESRGCFGVRVVLSKRAIVVDGIEDFVKIERAVCQFREIVLLAVVPTCARP
jgi:hypothetical protein